MINPKLHRYVEKLDSQQSYLVTEFVDNYEDGVMRRRDLIERVYSITGSVAAAAATLLALGVKPAHADPLASADAAPPLQTPPQSPLTVPANDPAVVAGKVTFRASDGATIMGYWARPNAAGRFPAVLICHENAGTSEHFEDVARRFAKKGYVGLHLDLLSRRGGTDAVPTNERGGALTGPGATDQWVSDFRAAMAFLRTQPFVIADRIGMTGYCFGGGVTLNVVAKEPTLRAAAPYYGTPAFPDELRNARAAVLGVYGGNDERVNATIPTVEAGLRAAGVPFKANIYPGAGHGFFNDTRATGYSDSASLAAWRDTLEWFGTYLRVAGASALPATGDGSTEGEATEPDQLTEE
ncbi:MAG TPA: dienelactone hydrolase family protein [Chloroflexota bacterium]|nr:dienelactone hydrolase family protein [Chloroflexota bacterium]